jgi:nicotianamine synthase
MSFSPDSIFEIFPYHENYVDLTRLEVSSLSCFPPSRTIGTCTTEPQTIAFLGSGPLPLSAFHLLEYFPTDTQIINIDRDQDALQVSSQLADSLGFGDRISSIQEEVGTSIPGPNDSAIGGIPDSASSVVPWSLVSILFFAALVGMDSSSKIEILADLRTKLTPGTLVVVRSAWGLRAVLYPVSCTFP